jgi:hypothetical protein
MTVALRISVVRDGKGRYVLGNGFAFGAETAPGPGDPGEFDAAVALGAFAGVGDVDAGADCACWAQLADAAASSINAIVRGVSIRDCIMCVDEKERGRT